MTNKLATPAPPHVQILARADLGEQTRAKYTREVDKLIQAGIDPRNTNQLAAYAAQLSQSSRAFLKAALKLLFADTATQLKAGATPENIAQVQAALLNLDAMSETIQVHKPEGTKAHIWLSQNQVDQLLSLPDTSTQEGMRDYIILSVLVGAGLRREELAELTTDALKRVPNGSTFRDVLEVTGKGNKTRVVPIAPILGERLRNWQTSGRVARSINKAGKLGDSLSPVGIFAIVRKYGAMIGIPELDPHDLRRTFGRLGWEATHDLILIKNLLGHSDAKTTQTYIGLDVKLDVTASDFIVREYNPSIGD